MKGVVQHRPPCRHCGAGVEPLRRCPGCGKRSILAFFMPSSWVRW